jgi:hypothetical protein
MDVAVKSLGRFKKRSICCRMRTSIVLLKNEILQLLQVFFSKSLTFEETHFHQDDLFHNRFLNIFTVIIRSLGLSQLETLRECLSHPNR